ncbi:hypothetical protein C464_17457 [Halorubrum coriense DSM 10284]|uniref:Uncharacterized protein n=1 Tax=Halorubrum coriense DSM 10284 TaxID=1227466 RepID=M0E4G3_9EURY|nr:hypothetical protein C464_17457 [Halorubrum coriense DSM 10284]
MESALVGRHLILDPHGILDVRIGSCVKRHILEKRHDKIFFDTTASPENSRRRLILNGRVLRFVVGFPLTLKQLMWGMPLRVTECVWRVSPRLAVAEILPDLTFSIPVGKGIFRDGFTEHPDPIMEL